MAARKKSAKNPKQRHARPPFKQRKLKPPGLDADMRPLADHGESSYQGQGRLSGKVALITGGDSGIGRAIAIAFAREGADCVISYLNEHSDAQETARLVQGAGRRALLVAGDIGKETHCRTLVKRTVREFGRLDVLINNAAFQRTHESIEEVSTAEFEKTFRTNVYAMFWLCREALPIMEAGSAIVNTTSIQATNPSPTLLAYATTKGAIATFTRSFAKEAINRGVRVNAVAPGPVWTPLVASTMPIEDIKQFGKDTPMERPGQPAELAPAFVFLASDDSRYITGEVIAVTGGKPVP
jgi:NAD(P)-dependent dehydrogenase (short-subunit alcohol dehydrogenase family)